MISGERQLVWQKAARCVFGNGMEMGMPMGMGIDCMEENGNAKNPVPVISTLNATADSDA